MLAYLLPTALAMAAMAMVRSLQQQHLVVVVGESRSIDFTAAVRFLILTAFPPKIKTTS